MGAQSWELQCHLPHTPGRTHCTHVCTGRDVVSSLGKADPVRVRSQSCSHPSPKLGSGLLRLFCNFSINIKSNYLDFFFY